MFNRLYNWLSGSKPSMTVNPSKNIGPTGSNRIDDFQRQLKTKEATLLANLENWKKHRETEFSTASSELQHLDVHDPFVHQKIRGIFSELLQVIKRWTLPAKWELAAVLKDAKPHLDELRDHRNQLCDELQKHTEAEATDEIKKIRIYICDTNIIMLNEFIQLINDVAKEIATCLEFKDGFQMGLNLGVDVLCDDMLKLFESLPAPKFNVDLTNIYDDFLYSEIEEDKNELEREEEQLEGGLERAEKILEKAPCAAANPNSLFNRRNIEASEPKETPVLALK